MSHAEANSWGTCGHQNYSKTGNVQQLQHDLRNRPNHVFDDYRECNSAFCKIRWNDEHSSDGSSSNGSSSDSESDNGEDRQDEQTLTAQFEDTMQSDLYDVPMATDDDIRIGHNITQFTCRTSGEGESLQ